MLTQHKHVASDFCYDLALILGPAVLQDVLDNVIPILILGGRQQQRSQKVDKWTRSIPTKLIPKVRSELEVQLKINYNIYCKSQLNTFYFCKNVHSRVVK